MKLRMRLTPELVARMHRDIADPGPVPGLPVTPEEYYQNTAETIVNEAGTSGLWIFAFGSLIWKPRFEFSEQRVGTIRGWHRAFTLGWDRRYRGSPKNPGLMLTLDRGGSCKGVVFRVAEAEIHQQIEGVLRSEPPMPPVWVRVATEAGPVRAIAFHTDRKSFFYVGGLSDAATADALTHAGGMLGTMPDYLHNTISHLEALGIHDRYLWRMQELVADRITALGK